MKVAALVALAVVLTIVACSVYYSARESKRQVQLLSDVHDPLRQCLDDIALAFDDGNCWLARDKTLMLQRSWSEYLKNGRRTPEQFASEIIDRGSSAGPSTHPATTQAATRSVSYDPATFRDDITNFIHAKDYRAAVALLNLADVNRQVAADGSGYIGIGGYSITVPGAGPGITFDRSRDWFMPGTSDYIVDWQWQDVATEFAVQYNGLRRGMSR
jgi:hypothetical protein